MLPPGSNPRRSKNPPPPPPPPRFPGGRSPGRRAPPRSNNPPPPPPPPPPRFPGGRSPGRRAPGGRSPGGNPSPPLSPGSSSPQPLNIPAYTNKRAELQNLRERVESLIKLLFSLANFHASFQGFCFGAVMATDFVSCSSSWYISVLAGLVALSNVLLIIVIAIQYHKMMIDYDIVWNNFDQLQNQVLAAQYPCEYFMIKYGFSILCADYLRSRKRAVLVGIGVCCYLLFTGMALGGPYLFLRGHQSRL